MLWSAKSQPQMFHRLFSDDFPGVLVISQPHEFDVANMIRIGESSPGESHPEALAEPSVRLSPHSAPIRQTRQSYRFASVQRDPRIPSQVVVETGSLGLCGV
jgi:hypothetical protein